jgi:hypothetical protein
MGLQAGQVINIADVAKKALEFWKLDRMSEQERRILEHLAKYGIDYTVTEIDAIAFSDEFDLLVDTWFEMSYNDFEA